MAFGLCLGGVGVGKCGNTSSKQAINIANTVVAEAYYSSAFTCDAEVDAGNELIVHGECGCDELGLGNNIDCNARKAEYERNKVEMCKIVSTIPNYPPEKIACICQVSDAGCVDGIDQQSSFTNKVSCKNLQDVKANIDNKFVNEMIQKMKQSMSDIGGLFDSNDQSVVSSLASNIKENISQEMVTDIASKVTATNTIVAGCGSQLSNVSQATKFTNVLDGLNKSSAIQSAINDLSNHIESTIERKDSGVLGWLTSVGGIITMIVIGLAIILGLYLLFKFKPWDKNKRK